MDFTVISKNNLHHAYFIEGDYGLVLPQLLEHIEKENISKKEHVSTNIIPVFYIENSREIKEKQLTVSDEARIIIVAFDRMIHAAQQALLKTIEEPTKNTHFIFINRNIKNLLPTVRSRLFILRTNNNSNNDYEVASKYLQSDLYGRTEILKDLISRARGEDDENDDDRAEGRRELVVFLDSLEEIIRNHLSDNYLENSNSLQLVISAKKDLSDTSPSIKMIFEHLAHRLPRLKNIH